MNEFIKRLIYFNKTLLLKVYSPVKIIFLLTFNQATHSEGALADDADHVMILGMETHLRDTPRGAGHSLGCCNNFSFLPEEVNQLEVRLTALRQQILGVV